MIGVDPTTIAKRTYTGVWAFLVKWFRVPEEPPTLPVAPGEQTISFKPSEAYLRYLKLLFWIVCVLIDLALTALWIVATVALIAAGVWYLAIPLVPIALALIIVPDVIAYVGIHLRYDTTWYVLSRRSLRLRHGIWMIGEMTLTFENVQNVRMSQGPLQRMYGIASVIVETAGGGSMGGKHGAHSSGHHASIDGVTNAEEIRDLILSRVRESRSAGLGDERHGAIFGHDARANERGAAPPGAGIRAAAFTARQMELLRGIRDELRAARGGG
ncbi:MAG: hypothetical protein FJ253_00895 [Phycisphaerae bacterium]|nr:hypothetical protein [Phycisphaerae bacterium]